MAWAVSGVVYLPSKRVPTWVIAAAIPVVVVALVLLGITLIGAIVGPGPG